jgi:thymidine phosphorylase
VDPRVGLLLLRGRGERVAKGDVFAELHLASTDAGLAQRALACFGFADAAPVPLPADLVHERV